MNLIKKILLSITVCGVMLCILIQNTTASEKGSPRLKSWISYGNPDFSKPATTRGSLTFSPDGLPYASFEDGNGNFSVMSLQNGKWDYIGKVITSYPDEMSSLTIDNKNVPYVAYTDSNNNTYVMKFDNKQWTLVGTVLKNADLSSAARQSLAIDNHNIPYVSLYITNSNGESILTVEKFDNNQWSSVGKIPSFPNASDFSMAIDPNGIPYIAISNLGSGSSSTSNNDVVMKWNQDSNNWETIGNALPIDNFNDFTSLVFNANGVPYLLAAHAFKKFEEGEALVFRLSGDNTWKQLGTTSFLTTYNSDASLIISSSNVPYISYSDYLNNDTLAVMSWNQSENKWVPAGNINISSGPVNFYTSLAIDLENHLCVLYDDVTQKGKATVKILR